MKAFLILLTVAISTTISGCMDDSVSVEPLVRGVKTLEITSTQNTSVRRYPSVLQPSDNTVLSFEISGKMRQHDVDVGQLVKKGEVLFSLDQRSLEIAVDSARASLDQTKATALNAASEFERQKTLFDRKLVSRASLDRAKTTHSTSKSQVIQAQKSLERAKQDLERSELKAPFDGIIKSVEKDSFVNVAAGEPVATLYKPGNFEARFSVSYDIVNRIHVGKELNVRLSDSSGVKLKAVVSELGGSGDVVSSYPVVVKLTDITEGLRYGMAVEVVLETKVSEDVGHALPISAMIIEGDLKLTSGSNDVIEGEVFVFDQNSETVKRKWVKIVGLRENQVIVSSGLEYGDRVVVAGVPFLKQGQKVKLLKSDRDQRQR